MVITRYGLQTITLLYETQFLFRWKRWLQGFYVQRLNAKLYLSNNKVPTRKTYAYFCIFIRPLPRLEVVLEHSSPYLSHRHFIGFVLHFKIRSDYYCSHTFKYQDTFVDGILCGMPMAFHDYHHHMNFNLKSIVLRISPCLLYFY